MWTWRRWPGFSTCWSSDDHGPNRGVVRLATGHTDMRKGFTSLALIVQEVLKRDLHGVHLFVFRGQRGDLIKVIWHDGQGRSCTPSAWATVVSYGRRRPMVG